MDDVDKSVSTSLSGGGRDGSIKTPVAVGVEYELNGQVEEALIATPGSHGRAGSAVVVTAGALFTPKVQYSTAHVLEMF